MFKPQIVYPLNGIVSHTLFEPSKPKTNPNSNPFADSISNQTSWPMISPIFQNNQPVRRQLFLILTPLNRVVNREWPRFSVFLQWQRVYDIYDDFWDVFKEIEILLPPYSAEEVGVNWWRTLSSDAAKVEYSDIAQDL